MVTEIEKIIEEISYTADNIEEGQLERVIQKINKAERIFVYGTGRSGLMLKTFAMRLMQMGYTSYVIGETVTPAVLQGDLLIAASASGETKSVCEAVETVKKQNIDIIAITANVNSTLFRLKKADIVIPSSTKFNTSKVSIQPLGSLFEQVLLIMFDAIILKMAERKEYMNNDMAKRHASIE